MGIDSLSGLSGFVLARLDVVIDLVVYKFCDFLGGLVIHDYFDVGELG